MNIYAIGSLILGIILVVVGLSLWIGEDKATWYMWTILGFGIFFLILSVIFFFFFGKKKKTA